MVQTMTSTALYDDISETLANCRSNFYSAKSSSGSISDGSLVVRPCSAITAIF